MANGYSLVYSEQAVKPGILGRAECRERIDTAVRDHGMRISIALYQGILEKLDHQ